MTSGSGRAPASDVVAPAASDVEHPGPLGRDWVLGPDGIWFRRGARVLVVDEEHRLLLLRAHDVDDPGRSWWFTVGGGVDDGEDGRAAAVREAREEVGLHLDPEELVGPVVRRSAVFDFARVHCRQDEEFYLAHVDSGRHRLAVDRDAWTDIERSTVDEVRWWTLPDLAQVSIEVFPHGLAGLVAGLLDGWDGVTRHLEGP